MLSNKGDIDVIFGLVEPANEAQKDKAFSLNPREGIVLPNGYQSIKINFSSKKLGPVEKKFVFEIDGAKKNLIVTVTFVKFTTNRGKDLALLFIYIHVL